MNWTLRKPNVALAVTKFAPETEMPVAGLTDEARAAHRAKRAAECAKVEPAMELDVHTDDPEPEYGDPRRDYADSVGMPLHERMR